MINTTKYFLHELCMFVCIYILCLFKGEEIQSYQGLFDQSFSVHGDCFGDEEMAVDLIGTVYISCFETISASHFSL